MRGAEEKFKAKVVDAKQVEICIYDAFGWQRALLPNTTLYGDVGSGSVVVMVPGCYRWAND